ncbi:DNA starvation/stationary phase protection protein [bacterium]|nr:DNA starvation/stationary phase protection protein [bacterium]
MKIDIGIDEGKRQNIAKGLSSVLADSYAVYLKTHNYHWNVTGPMFQALHTMFETQYTELAIAVDDLAERIRSLGSFAPGSFKQYMELSSIKDSDEVPNAKTMVANLVQAHEAVVRTIRPVLSQASEASDDATADLLTQRLNIHEKSAWMLRSILEDQ